MFGEYEQQLLKHLEHVPTQMLEVVSKEFTNRLIIKLVQTMKDTFDKQQVAELLNQQDDFGYSLVHYFSHINYHEALKLMIESGVDINVKSSNKL
jgi:hypothetical protein